jgi:hypothetical protein
MADSVSRLRELLSCCVGRWYDHLERAEAELKRDETQRRDSLPLDQVNTLIRNRSLGLAAGDVANADGSKRKQSCHLSIFWCTMMGR